MHNISGLNFITAPLSEEKKERGPEKGRLMLVDSPGVKSILWLTPEEQTKARKNGARISENLEAIAQALPDVIASSQLDNNCAPILLKNISWINQRIKSHNEKLANSKLRSFFSKIFPWDRRYDPLAMPTLLAEIQKQAHPLTVLRLLTNCSPEQQDEILKSKQLGDPVFLCNRCLDEFPDNALIVKLLFDYMPKEDRNDILQSRTPDQAVALFNLISHLRPKEAKGVEPAFSGAARMAIMQDLQAKMMPTGKSSQPPSSQRLSLNPASTSYSTARTAATPRPLAEVYAGRSFLRQERLDFSQKGASLSDQQWETVSQLIEGHHQETLNELQQHKEFRVAVQQRLSQNPPDALKHLIPALKAFESYPPSFQAQGGFLKTLLFIEKNKAQLFQDGHIVSVSKRYEHLGLVKIKSNDPNDPSQTAIFDPKTGQVKYINFHKTIGSGGFKDKVKKVSDNNQMLAVSRQTRELGLAQKELDIAEKLKNNKNIDTSNMILPTGHPYRNHNNVEVMMTETPFCEQGDLFNAIQNPNSCLYVDEQGKTRSPSDQLAVRLGIMKDMCWGTFNVHKGGIVHRDLKPENCLLTYGNDPKTGKRRLILKIADFGLAREENSRNIPGGSPLYIAPETWSDQIQDKKSDVWAIGVMLSLCHTGQYPYKTASTQPNDILDASLLLENDTCRVKELENLFNTLKTTKDKQKELQKLPDLMKQATPDAIQKAVTWGLTRPNPAKRWDLEFALAILESLEKTV